MNHLLIKRNCLFVTLWTGLLIGSCLVGCIKSKQSESARISQKMKNESGKSKTHPLRQGIRNLQQTNQISRKEAMGETRVLMNAWLNSADQSAVEYQPTKLLDQLDPRALDAVGCLNPNAQQLGGMDIDCLFEANLMKHLSEWIVAQPVRDRVFQPMLDKECAQLPAEESHKLQTAYKLFDWTVRNIKLSNTESSLPSSKIRDPRPPVTENAVGYSYTPWETLIFCTGDFIARGRIFSALATQQGINTCWISVGSAPGAAGDLFTMGVLIDNRVLLFEPKLGLPILDPDSDKWASLQDVSQNDKILRRLNLPQYEYGFQQPSIHSIQLLIDATPFSLSRRAKLLESALLGSERMVLHNDLDAVAARFVKAAPQATVSIWYLPLLAQVYSAEIQKRLQELSQFSMRYMAEHLIWLTESSVAQGRFQHLLGKFDNEGDSPGALPLYMDVRVDDTTLKKMLYNPDVQRALDLVRESGEDERQFEARVMQAAMVFSRAKFDASFLLGELLFDRGEYKSAAFWCNEKLLKDARGQRWFAPGWYLLARAYTEMGQYGLAEEALIKPSIDQSNQQPNYVVNPQDAGNRIRLRYLKRFVAAQNSQSSADENEIEKNN